MLSYLFWRHSVGVRKMRKGLAVDPHPMFDDLDQHINIACIYDDSRTTGEYLKRMMNQFP